MLSSDSWLVRHSVYSNLAMVRRRECFLSVSLVSSVYILYVTPQSDRMIMPTQVGPQIFLRVIVDETRFFSSNLAHSRPVDGMPAKC